MHLHYMLFCLERFDMVLQKRINIEYALFQSTIIQSSMLQNSVYLQWNRICKT